MQPPAPLTNAQARDISKKFKEIASNEATEFKQRVRKTAAELATSLREDRFAEEPSAMVSW